MINWKTSCDKELLSGLSDSSVDRQTSCDWELSSELIESPINQQISVFLSDQNPAIYYFHYFSPYFMKSSFFLVSLATVAIWAINQLMKIILH